MTYAYPRDLVPRLGEWASSNRRKGSASRPGVLRRMFNALFESRQEQADGDIARLLARSGGRLTDDMEREMTQRLFRGNWNPRQ